MVGWRMEGCGVGVEGGGGPLRGILPFSSLLVWRSKQGFGNGVYVSVYV